MARTGFAQVAQFSSVAIAGLQSVDIEKAHGRVAVGSLDGMQGAQFAAARGDQNITGTVVHEDVEKMVTLLTTLATETDSFWFEKEAGAATFTKNMLKFPVFGAMNFSSGIGRKAQVTHRIQCRFGAAETFEDVHTKLAAQTEPTRTVPVSAGDPVGFIFDPSGTPISIAHLREFSFALGGEFVTDSSPGFKGRDAVEFQPGLLTFSVTYRDTDLAAGGKFVQEFEIVFLDVRA